MDALIDAGERAAEIMRHRIQFVLSPSNASIRASLPAFAVARAYTVANRTVSPELLTNITMAALAAATRLASGNTSALSAIDRDMARFLNTSSLIEGLGVNVDSMMTFSYAASAPLATQSPASVSLSWVAAPVVLGLLCLLLLLCCLIVCARRRRRKQKRIVKPNPNDTHGASITVYPK
jgi:hypothetical protein